MYMGASPYGTGEVVLREEYAQSTLSDEGQDPIWWTELNTTPDEVHTLHW